MIVFERANLLFIFNLHPTQSFADYRIGSNISGKLKVVLSSDESRFFGHERIDLNGEYFTTAGDWDGRANWLQVTHSYAPFSRIIQLTHILLCMCVCL